MKNVARSLELDEESGGFTFSKKIKKKDKKQKKQELIKKAQQDERDRKNI